MPGQKMLIDFAGDRLSYVDTETGEEVFVQTYVAILPFSGLDTTKSGSVQQI